MTTLSLVRSIPRNVQRRVCYMLHDPYCGAVALLSVTR
jgi:hypothetical protein